MKKTSVFSVRLLAVSLSLFLFLAGSAIRAAAVEADNPPVGWWRDAVFYEVFVRSFADATSGPLAGDGIGDLQGLIERLDYLNDGRGTQGTSLGVTALWLMPIYPSPSYHGYDVTDYFSVNRDYGDIALCKQFMQEAHRRGIRVILDLVLNHSSSQHPLFLKAVAAGPGSAERSLFRFAELPEQLEGPWGQRAWHPTKGGFYYGVFTSEMPDWNLNEPAVTDHHHRLAKFWLEEVGVDGFRLDAVRYFDESGEELQDTARTRQWLKEFTAYCHAVKPGAFVVAENTAHMPEVARCIRGDSVDSSFEFDLAKATIESVRLRTPGILSQALQRLDVLYDGGSPWSTFITNHDQERARTQLDGHLAQTRLAVKLFLTLPGVPFLYYGEELGMQAGKPDPELRTPMPWTAVAPNAGFTAPGVSAWKAPRPDFATVNVASQLNASDSMRELYRQLVRLNMGSPALRHGKPVAVQSSDRGVYVQLRETEHEVVLVLGNFSETEAAGVKLTVTRSRIRKDWTLGEELESARVVAPILNEDGGFEQWQPLAKLAPESVYVVRWRR